MNRKGFTLIEMLAVVIILVLLIIIVFPSITNSVRNHSKKTDDLMFSMIKSATELYISDFTSIKKENGNNYCIPISNLVENDYLKSNIEYDGQDITNSKGIKIVYEDGFSYELVDMTECIELQKNSGYSLIFHPKGGKFIKPGYNLYNKDNPGNYEDETKGLYVNEENIVNVKLDNNYYVDMSDDIPIRSGYKFLGWYTKDDVMIYDSSGFAVNDGKYFKNNTWVYNGNLTLYAKWEFTGDEVPEVYDIKVYINDLLVTKDNIDIEPSDDVRFRVFNSSGDEVTEEVWVAYNSNYDDVVNESRINLSQSGENIIEFGDEEFNIIYGSITVNYKYYDIYFSINDEIYDFYDIEISTYDTIDIVINDSSGNDISESVYLEVIEDDSVVYYGSISNFNISSAFGDREGGEIFINLGNGIDNDYYGSTVGNYIKKEWPVFGTYVCNSRDCEVLEESSVQCEYGNDGDYDTFDYFRISDDGNEVYIVKGIPDYEAYDEESICNDHGRAEEWNYVYNQGYNDGYYGETYSPEAYDGIFLDAYNIGYDEGVMQREEQDSFYDTYENGYNKGCYDGEIGDTAADCDASLYGELYCDGYHDGYSQGSMSGC